MSKGELTRKAIQQAISRIEKGRSRVVKKTRKLNIASVAKEAGISRASIHNNHPDLADLIQAKANRTVRQQRDAKNEALTAEKERSRSLRETIAEQDEEIARLKSIQACLMIENQELNALLKVKSVTRLMRGKP